MQVNANPQLKGGARKQTNNEKYRHALPLVFTKSSWHSRVLGVVGLGSGEASLPILG